jgi:hypothetical protein
MASRLDVLPRTGLIRRRCRSVGLMLLVVAMLLAWFFYQWQNLRRDSFTSGYLLIAAVFFLCAYNARKRFPSIHWLGSSSGWMQLHIYVALGSFAVFVWHVGLRVPNGILEGSLAAMYLTVFGSGLVGLFWTRTIPRRLTAVGEQVIFEQIPLLQRDVVRQVRGLLFESPGKSIVLCRFYVQRLADFFERSRPVSYLVRPRGHACRAIIREIEDLDRYLSAGHRETGRKLSELVRRKDDLDYHRALQGRLKIWLFLHIGLTYSLVIVAIVHGITVHAFHGGLR